MRLLLLVAFLAAPETVHPIFVAPHDPMDLNTGEAAPWAGGLCDAATAKLILEKRRACELERDALKAELAKPTVGEAGGFIAVGLVGILVGAIAGALVIGLAKR
jgi:hypothetical protein